MWTALVVSGAFLALVPAASASGERSGPRSALPDARTAEIAQYHGSTRGQYHEIAGSSARLSAWLSGPWSPGGELRNAISAQVISPIFTRDSVFGSRKGPSDRLAGSSNWIGSQNARQSHPETGSDPRAMVELATVLGLVYIAFLAVWFWATRFRVRPPSSAPS
jgi:hypothetical protein